jgi:hypothetical protein
MTESIEKQMKMCADVVTANIAARISSENNIPLTDALREFMLTKTYKLLQDIRSYLCVESKEYVWDMLECEKRGDYAGWMRI